MLLLVYNTGKSFSPLCPNFFISSDGWVQGLSKVTQTAVGIYPTNISHLMCWMLHYFHLLTLNNFMILAKKKKKGVWGSLL